MKHTDWLHTQLQNDEFAAEYLSQAALDLEPQVFTGALRHVVDARGGIQSVAKEGQLTRQSLYRSLSANGNPTARTLFASLRATGLQLKVSAQPVAKKRSRTPSIAA